MHICSLQNMSNCVAYPTPSLPTCRNRYGVENVVLSDIVRPTTGILDEGWCFVCVCVCVCVCESI